MEGCEVGVQKVCKVSSVRIGGERYRMNVFAHEMGTLGGGGEATFCIPCMFKSTKFRLRGGCCLPAKCWLVG